MRIGIVNDMPLAREALTRALETSPHTVAWVACDGAEAIAGCANDAPDLVLMDLVMPELDGVEATRQIMAQTPCPILIVTASSDSNSEMVYEAMGFGALDVTNTPVLDSGGEVSAAPLLQKIAQIGVITGISANRNFKDCTRVPFQSHRRSFPPFLAIGSSTGGPQALATIVSDLPPDFPAAIGIVQHVDAEFASGLADWLNQRSALAVKIAEDKEHALAGCIYISAGDRHLRVDSVGRFIYTDEPVAAINRPSVDIFFKSLAYAYPNPGCALLLTGMGRDGAEGLKSLRENGWQTIAQDKESSIVYGMPKAAMELGAAIEQRPLAEMAKAVRGYFAERE